MSQTDEKLAMVKLLSELVSKVEKVLDKNKNIKPSTKKLLIEVNDLSENVISEYIKRYKL